jgi:signal transduction histidine kinase/ligand-binding sensor domain-containing protein
MASSLPRPRRVICMALGVLSLLLLQGIACADPVQLQHTAWSTADGAPADIWAMAQGRDGYLWLGTGDSLYKFDGVRFERFKDRAGHELPFADVTALAILPDGDTWVGYYQGGISRIRDGAVTTFTAADGLPRGWVSAFAVDASGALWASTDGGLARFQRGRWNTVGDSMGFHGDHAGWVLTDPQGTLWVTGRDHVFFLRAGDVRFTETRARVSRNTNLARAPDGTLWATDRLRGVRALPGLSAEHPERDFPDPPAGHPIINGGRLLFDHEGRLWGTDHTAGGVFMVEDPASVAAGSLLQEEEVSVRFEGSASLTSDQASPLLEDAERNVWVGTNFGLDSFRHANVATLGGLSANSGDLFSLTTDASGTIWAASGHALYRWDNGHLKTVATFPTTIFDLMADPAGGMWFRNQDGMYRWDHGVAVALGTPVDVPDPTLTAEAPDRAGGLWAAFALAGVYHWSAGRWIPWPAAPPAISNVTAMATTEHGTLWLGLPDDEVIAADGQARKHYRASDGLHIGATLSIDSNGDDILLGGEHGVAWKQDKTFRSLGSLGAFALSGVSGIARDADTTWLNTSRAVVRITSGELRQALTHPGYVPDFRLFAPQDGLPGIALQTAPRSTLRLDAHGRIWIETNKGLGIIDPSRVRTNYIPPPVSIRFIETDKGEFEARHGLELPRLTTRIRIAYTATSLSVPGRVQFRYRLRGVDSDWQNAGTRREAFYTNLGPGTYDFTVVAANEDGVWSPSGASLGFTIAPAFYQTWWFILCCIVLTGSLAALAIQRRIHRYANQLKLRLEERHGERERIARELHDTLLQSIHALVLRFEGVARYVKDNAQARKLLEETLDLADELIVEGRDRVSELRTDHACTAGILIAIETTGVRLGLMHGFEFAVRRQGMPRPLRPFIAEECLAIAREAIVNSARHSGATQVIARVEFGRKQFFLSISDNGSGCDADWLTHPPEGHFGIVGMKERASHIGAALNLRANAETGTSVSIEVPARHAYSRQS